jgi:hypothetical protein
MSFEFAPGVFYTYFYNHARRLRLEKLSYIELSRSSDRYFKPLLDPDGGFTSLTTARRFHFFNHRTAVSDGKRPLRNRSGSEAVIIQTYNGYM